MSKTVKIVIGVYIFGCLLLYFGAPNTILMFCATREWNYLPEQDLVSHLFDSAVYLLRPFLAVVICGWAIFIPIALPWGLWGHVDDIFGISRRRKERREREEQEEQESE